MKTNSTNYSPSKPIICLTEAIISTETSKYFTTFWLNLSAPNLDPIKPPVTTAKVNGSNISKSNTNSPDSELPTNPDAELTQIKSAEIPAVVLTSDHLNRSTKGRGKYPHLHQ